MSETGLNELLGGFWKAPVTCAFASLGLPAAMGDAPVKADALAAKVGADPHSVYRLLRAAASLELVTHHGDDGFTLTKAGKLLQPGVPGSMYGRSLHVGTMLAPAFAQLAGAVRTGAPPEGIKFGPDGFAELNEDPAAAGIFNQAMVDGSRRIAALAADTYDFSDVESFLDVGGGYGAVVSTLLQRVPSARGAVLDLPHAKEGAEKLWVADGVADRAHYVTGSFFDPFPESAACYVLKYIIHDWNDDYAAKIMARVGEAAKTSNGKLILIERVLPERMTADHTGGAYSDLTMMLWGGAERTEAEFRALFEQAGLCLTQLVPIGDEHFVIEGRPA